MDEGAAVNPLAAATANTPRNLASVLFDCGGISESSTEIEADSEINEGAVKNPLVTATANTSRNKDSKLCGVENDGDNLELEGICMENIGDVEEESLRPEREQDELQWNLWHVGEVRGKREALAFTRAKRTVASLGASNDYAPRKVSTENSCAN